jgi:sec-independent protein translocase protein TatA
MGIGLTEWLLIAVVLLLLFGPKKLPELGKALGKTLREFKKGARDMMGEDDDDVKGKSQLQPASAASSVQPPAAEKKDSDSRRLPE